MIAEALAWLREQNEKAAGVNAVQMPLYPETMYYRGELGVIEVPPPEEHRPAVVGFTTLQGFVSFLDLEEHEGRPPSFIRVTSPTEVTAFGPVIGRKHERPVMAKVRCEDGSGPIDQLKHYSRQAEMVTALQAGCVPSAELTALLAVVGTIQQDKGVTQKDDGVSQSVVVKQNLELHKQELPNPVRLRVRCTFPEVKQPERLYTLRANVETMQMALIPSDGGAWRIEASRSIAEWLGEQTPVPVME